MKKMCSLMGIGCNEEDIKEKVLDKVKREKALNYDEQKIYIKYLEEELSRCRKIQEVM